MHCFEWFPESIESYYLSVNNVINLVKFNRFHCMHLSLFETFLVILRIFLNVNSFEIYTFSSVKFFQSYYFRIKKKK